MRVLDFLSYYWSARTSYQIDSPFVFNFIQEVLDSKSIHPYLADIQTFRNKLLQDNSKLRLEPMGAGSSTLNRSESTVSSMARASLSSPGQQAFLYRLVRRYLPETMLELGTSFGLATIHQQLGNPKAHLISIEGQRPIYEKALEIIQQFRHFNNRPNLKLGTFEEQLPLALAQWPKLDYLFLDGDHRYEAVLKNYLTCQPHLHEDSMVVIHDIYWSQGMKEAWNHIKRRAEVTVALDLFHSGVLFFSSDIREPIYLSLIPSQWKPLNWGFFR